MPSRPTGHSAWRNALLVILLVCAGVGYLRSLEDALDGFDRRANRAGPPLSWRLRKAPVVALAECLEGARGRLPEGGVVAFTGPAERAEQRLLRWRWAAYFLPEFDVVMYRGEATVGDPGYVVACRRELGGDARLLEVARLPGGRLYRVREAAGGAGAAAQSGQVNDEAPR